MPGLTSLPTPIPTKIGLLKTTYSDGTFTLSEIKKN